MEVCGEGSEYLRSGSQRVNNHEVNSRKFPTLITASARLQGERAGLRWCKVQCKREKGGGKNAFAYTQNTLRLYAKHLAPIRKISSPERKNKRHFLRLSREQAARMPSRERPEGGSSCFPRATPWENWRGNHRPEGAKANC